SKRCHQPPRRRQWFGDSPQECLPVLATKDHTFMILEDTARAFVGEIARSKPRDCRRPLDELPHGGRYPEFYPLGLALVPGPSRRSHDNMCTATQRTCQSRCPLR